jgi:DNA recombination protein RmuC
VEVRVDGLLVAVLVAVGALVGLLAGALAARRGGGTALEARLTGFSADLDRRLEALDRRLWTGLDMVQHGQADAASVAAEVRERIAQLGGTAQQVLDQGRELGKLGDLLRPPQARGAFGELLLEQVLTQGLPPGTWRPQHGFRSGVRVDVAITVGEHLVPVDAKFPLDAFARMTEPGLDDAGRTAWRRSFVRDARRHVDAIADKYICPDEGTLDFALCYVPSEAVYYEFLRDDQTGESVFRYAAGRRVFPVSPTTLYAYLLSVGVGLRGLRVEANARRILDALQALSGDLDRFRAEFDVVGRHLVNARAKWDEAIRRLDRFDARLGEIAERADELGTSQPREDDDPAPDAPDRSAVVDADATVDAGAGRLTAAG